MTRFWLIAALLCCAALAAAQPLYYDEVSFVLVTQLPDVPLTAVGWVTEFLIFPNHPNIQGFVIVAEVNGQPQRQEVWIGEGAKCAVAVFPGQESDVSLVRIQPVYTENLIRR